MSGRLIAVVGPSGVGKDSVMAGIAAAAPHIRLVRRVVTRTPDIGCEPHDTVDAKRFEAMQVAGAFCLHWGAHGLLYGIPAKVLESVRQGETHMANLSRGILKDAQAVFPALTVLNITARPEVLAKRLALRGREDRAEIQRRLARASIALPDGVPAIDLPNNAALEEAVARALALLQSETVGRCG
ncbi:phosphonate metabolism protein/1,5-bisphosphokinase (PRPP-forming) PhnN [Primorskyibacter sp. 2E233]|uniref:phosphonate metabolism protein/1,5-bisphosphokinase (PRPP-forming) PhnN n=1 Tax=Primorskyibacter sp. 2E233 TaxID=3413431 RepID=UPI003BF10699